MDPFNIPKFSDFYNLVGTFYFSKSTQQQRHKPCSLFFFRITNHPIKFTRRNSSALTRIFSLSRDSISMKVKFPSGDLGEPTEHGTRIKRLLSCNNANVDVKETAMLFWYTKKSKLCVSLGSVTINNANNETFHKLALD